MGWESCSIFIAFIALLIIISSPQKVNWVFMLLLPLALACSITITFLVSISLKPRQKDSKVIGRPRSLLVIWKTEAKVSREQAT